MFIRLLVVLAVALTAAPAHAAHYAGYHQRDRLLTIADCAPGRAVPYAVAVWGRSDVIDVRRVSCSARADVRARTHNFGRNNGLVAHSWKIDRRRHLYAATIFFNSYYFTSTNDRRSLACFIVGRALGLRERGPRDTTSCMGGRDPTLPLSPDAHDYAQLRAIYRHTHR